MLQSIQWPETLSHFKKLMLRQELKHPVGLQMRCDGQCWAGSWGERGQAKTDTLVSPPPHPLRSPVPGACGCSPWEERLPRSYLTPGSLLLGCDGTPEVVRSERSYCTSLGLCSNWTLCWPVVGHPKHLPFAAFLTVLGCYGVLSPLIVYHNHPWEQNSVMVEAIAKHDK